jgi:hypothetical protein
MGSPRIAVHAPVARSPRAAEVIILTPEILYMASHTEANKNNPDAQAPWAWNDETMQFAERAYRSWLREAETIQTQALDFWNTEMQKGIEAMNEMAKCQTAAEAFNVQTRYATEAVQGFIAEGQKVIDQLASFTKTPWATTTLVPHTNGAASEGHGERARSRRAK